MSQRASITRKLFVPRLLWGALLVSQAVYLGMAIIEVLEPGGGPHDPMIVPMLTGIAVAAAVGSFVLPGQVRRKALEKTHFDLRDAPDPDAVVGFRGATPTIRTYADPADAWSKAMRIGLAPYIVSLALSEAVSVLGFVLYVLGYAPLVWAPFFACGMTLTALRFPNADTFLRPIEEHTGVRMPR